MKNRIIKLYDVLIAPFLFLSSWIFFIARKIGVENFPISKRIFNNIGVFPILDHYYEPLFNPKHLYKSLSEDRELPGIDLNVKEQLQFLKKLNYTEELKIIPLKKTGVNEFYFNNGGFESGDAEILYSMIRYYQPGKIVEIGSGNSTLIAINAIEKNKSLNDKYNCEHICIEPYEMKWLEEKDVKVFRNVVEKIDKKIFSGLESNDILFIDSSHIIRPQGDVLFEFLEVLPTLKKGVLIHIHDIFTPKDYPFDWVINKIRMWNEQYLLEAFLCFNKEFKIIAALNFLKHHHFNEIASACPVLKDNPAAEPGSFWLIKI